MERGHYGSLLWEDSAHALFRGQRHAAPDCGPVLRLVPVEEHPTPGILRRFAHELSLRDELGSDYAVRPLKLEREDDRTVLVLEDPGGHPLATVLGHLSA